MFKQVKNLSIYEYVQQLPEIAYLTAYPNDQKKGAFAVANDLTRKLWGYKNMNSLEGSYYEDIPCSAAELSAAYIYEDQKVNESKQTVKLLAGLRYSDHEYRILIGRKIPIQIQADVRGIICEGFDITNNGVLSITSLAEKDARSFCSRNGQFVYILNSNYESKDFKFTKRESECLFFLLRCKTSKEIARILCISHRTVEKHIDNIKSKLNVNNRSALVEKAIGYGLVGIIPESVLQIAFQKLF